MSFGTQRGLSTLERKKRFKQYLPNKPDKFGIKFWLASDVQTKYVVNEFSYLGKSEKALPETVEFCNKTKFGVDTADQMAQKI